MNKQEILDFRTTPVTSPGYEWWPKFSVTQNLLISYESDPEAIRQALPEPLQPDGSNTVKLRFAHIQSSIMPDLCELMVDIPCIFNGDEYSFITQTYLNNVQGILSGREVIGWPKKWGDVSYKVSDASILTGALHSETNLVAMATMRIRQKQLDCDVISKEYAKKRIVLKMIPHPDAMRLQVAQLVSFNISDVVVRYATTGSARLCLNPHMEMPIADFPVRKVLDGKCFLMESDFSYGTVIHDYLAE